MKILKSIHSTESFTKYLIPKDNSDECKDWVEISIDYTTNVFTAKKIYCPHIQGEWEEYNNATFPSSLFNEFLRSDY